MGWFPKPSFEAAIKPANRKQRVQEIMLERFEVSSMDLIKLMATTTPSKCFSEYFASIRELGIKPVMEWRRSPKGKRYKVWRLFYQDKMKLQKAI